jgi:predicted transposase/invertase (TIGR01784 family)
LVDPQYNREREEDEFSIIDIKAVDNQGRQYTIEVHVSDDLCFDKRSLYYMAKNFASQLKKGMPFNSLEKTIGIYIMNFNELEEEKDYHNVYRFSNIKSHRELTDLLELDFIELDKFIKTIDEPWNELDKWTSFLATSDNYEKDALPGFYE